MSRTILRFPPSPRSPRHARTTSSTRCRAGDKRKGEGEAPHVRAGRNAGRNGAPRRSMPDGEKSGTGRGSPSRQGRTGSRTEWARHPAQCRAVSAHGRAKRRAERNALPHQGRTGSRTEWARHPAQCRAVSAQGRAERRAERNALPHQGRTGKRRNAVPASRSGATTGEKHIDAGRGKCGTGRGSPSRQGRTGSRTEWARHPAQCRAVSAHGRAERRAVRCAPPHQSRTGKRKNAVPASRSGAAPGEKHIDAGRRKCGTGRVVLSYQSRARTADGAGMEARPPGRSVERLAAAQA